MDTEIDDTKIKMDKGQKLTFLLNDKEDYCFVNNSNIIYNNEQNTLDPVRYKRFYCDNDELQGYLKVFSNTEQYFFSSKDVTRTINDIEEFSILHNLFRVMDKFVYESG